jgi:YD repeat-containing protein
MRPVAALVLILSVTSGLVPAGCGTAGPIPNAEPAVVSALDAHAFVAPFGNVPISAPFVGAKQIQKLSVHYDRKVDEGVIADFRTEVFEFNSDGGPVVQTEYDLGKQVMETIHHYEAGRPVRVSATHSMGRASVKTHEYDPAGRLVRTSTHGNVPDEITAVYDDRGRVTEAVRSLDGKAQAVRRATYDDQGRLARVVILNPDDTVRATDSFSYDAHGRLDTRKGTGYNRSVDLYRFAYDTAGALKEVRFTEGDKPIYLRT